MKKSLTLAGLAQFGGNALGLVLAVFISVMLAARLGAGLESDAFVFGRRIITGLTEMLSQILVIFFIPLVVQKMANSATGEIADLRRPLILTTLVGIAMTAVLVLLADPIAHLMLPQSTSAKLALSAKVMAAFAVCLPAVLVGTLFAAVLNAHGGFGGPALLRQIPRVAILAMLIWWSGDVVVVAAYGFSVAWFFVAAILAWLAFISMKTGAADTTTDLAEDATKTRPLVYGIAALLLISGGQGAIWIETYYAAALGAGQLTLLELSQRLGALMGNTLGAALTLPIFALWARSTGARNYGLLVRLTLTGLVLLAFMQSFFALNGENLIDLLYGRGALSEADQAQLLTIFTLITVTPLSVFIMRMVFVWHLTSQNRAVIPGTVLAVLLDLGVRLVLYRMLTPVLGLSALPVAMGVAPLAVAALLAAISFRNAPKGPPLGRYKTLPLVALAGIAGLWSGRTLGLIIAGHWPASGQGENLAVLSLSGFTGCAFFALSWIVLRIPRSFRG